MLDEFVAAMALPLAAFISAFFIPIALALVVCGITALATGRGAKGLAIAVALAVVVIAGAVFLWAYGSARVVTHGEVIVAGATRNFELFLPYGIGAAVLIALWLSVPMVMKSRRT